MAELRSDSDSGSIVLTRGELRTIRRSLLVAMADAKSLANETTQDVAIRQSYRKDQQEYEILYDSLLSRFGE